MINKSKMVHSVETTDQEENNINDEYIRRKPFDQINNYIFKD